jgi:hypothetical protein
MACDFLNDFEAPTKGRTKKLLKIGQMRGLFLIACKL